ncbi:universal stress protein [Streptomyces sp. NPDC005474]|uniref:universal stress protein n=1 Tax=Streptomyces sp. NPDC005474 TaxID=3154878 RepID=UPI00345347F6
MAVEFAFREAHLRHCRLLAVHARSVAVGNPGPPGPVRLRPRQALLNAASGAELLVAGARRRHGRVGLQLGLVNHAVLHHAPCPIAVVPQIGPGRARMSPVVCRRGLLAR